MSSDIPSRILAAELHDGGGGDPRADQLVEIAAGRIVAVRPATREDAREKGIVAAVLAPGFIDLQINGAADCQFNFDPRPETLAGLAAGARAGGTALCLPTFITAPGQDYARAIDAARAAIEAGLPGILGLHLEGPFLSPHRPGIHPAAAIRPLDEADIDRLCAPFPGPFLITLAPEAQRPGAIAALVRAGRLVFAGHSEATANEIAAAEAEGLRGVTHLFNAMSQMTSRAPGVVGAVLGSDSMFAGLIADGHHVAWPNVRTAARALPDRLCLVTDAMLTFAGTTRSFDLGEERIVLSDGRLTNAEGRLAGAHLAMDESVANMVRHGGVSRGRAIAMASAAPARALGLGDELGRIAEGYRACLTLLDADLSCQAVMVDGALFEGPGQG